MKAINLQAVQANNTNSSIGSPSSVLEFKLDVKSIKPRLGTLSPNGKHEWYNIEYSTDVDGNVIIGKDLLVNTLSAHTVAVNAYEKDETIRGIIDSVLMKKDVKHGNIESDYRHLVKGTCTFKVIELTDYPGEYKLWTITPDAQPSRPTRSRGRSRGLSRL
jgi:hypothetical protein